MRSARVSPENTLHTCQNRNDKYPSTWEGCRRPNCLKAVRFDNPLARPYTCHGSRTRDPLNTKQLPHRVSDCYNYSTSLLPKRSILNTNLFPAPRVDVPHISKGYVTEDHRTSKLPARFHNQNSATKYGSQLRPVHPFYRTTSMDYGWYPPTIYTLPHHYFTTNNRFTRRLASAGMYKNYSLNTELDKSVV